MWLEENKEILSYKPGHKEERKERQHRKTTNKEQKQNRRLSRVLPGHHSYHTRNVDGQMHWQKHTGSRGTNSSGVWLTFKEISKKGAQLYMMREMVLPEDEMRIFNVPLETRLKDTDQQL